MKICRYKVLDEFKFNDIKNNHEDTVYVLQRRPAYYYIEVTVDDERIGLVFDKDENGVVKCELLGFVWVEDAKFSKDTIQSLLRKALLVVPMESYQYHLAKCDMLLFQWFDYISGLREDSDSFFIQSISDDYILFSNGKRVSYGHEPDCCEWNYANFYGVDDTVLDYNFHEPLVWDKIEGYGFRFGNNGKMINVPCFSEQDGYYSDDVDIYYDGVRVLNTTGRLLED